MSDLDGAPSLAAALESLLIISEDPVVPADLAEFLDVAELDVVGQLRTLAAQYEVEQRGFELRQLEDGWRLYSAKGCADLVARYVTEGQTAKLSMAALETLTIIAYRQPVARAHVAAIRGVNSDGVIRNLAARGLIEESGEDSATGAVLFGTTAYFLDRMGLDSIAELPPIAEHVPDIASLDDLVDQ